MKEVCEELFAKYSLEDNKGKYMTIQMVADYLSRATKRKRQINDPSVEEMFKYANNPISNFSVELSQVVMREVDFIRYYRKKCEEPNMVFLHLRALGIRKDLKKHVDEPAKPHFDGV